MHTQKVAITIPKELVIMIDSISKKKRAIPEQIYFHGTQGKPHVAT